MLTKPCIAAKASAGQLQVEQAECVCDKLTWEQPLQVGHSLMDLAITLGLLAISLGLCQGTFTIKHLPCKETPLCPAHQSHSAGGWAVICCCCTAFMHSALNCQLGHCTGLVRLLHQQSKAKLEHSTQCMTVVTTSTAMLYMEDRVAHPAFRLASATAPRSFFFSRRSFLPAFMFRTSLS